jgi:CheY-like chemotaxis protein
MQPDHHRVLLVEDHQDAREALAALLRLAGFEVVEVSDGAEALVQLRSGLEPCVILLDLMMPGVDGYRFREEQLRVAEFTAIPVVVVSGAGRLDQRAAELGIRDFIAKPIDVDRFLALVGQYCQHSHAST